MRRLRRLHRTPFRAAAHGALMVCGRGRNAQPRLANAIIDPSCLQAHVLFGNTVRGAHAWTIHACMLASDSLFPSLLASAGAKKKDGKRACAFGTMFGFLVLKRCCLWTSVECHKCVHVALPVLSCVRVIFKEIGIVGPENQKIFRPRGAGRSQISN